ncbi:MAG: response regulator [Oscillatoriales cyanobacterium]|nr:MAG: response regulator [Oscillatoriales cyanobacterium]TAH16248.1 MAG: response regulator [Oscillatoriales cyanobacterium]
MPYYFYETIAVEAMKAGAQDYLIKEQITPQRLQLAINGAIERVHLHAQLQQRIERERLVAQISQKLHQTLDLAEILQTTVTEVRRFLLTDRVLIFRLQSDGWGTVITESVGNDCISLLSSSHHDPCLSEEYIEPFRRGLVTIKSDVHDGKLDPCHVELLEKLQVRANLVVPILQNGQLWGMLIAHHCAAPRQWQELEVDLLKELAIQAGIALQQAELYQQGQNELIERTRLEVELREREERLRQTLAGAHAGSWDWEILTGKIIGSPENYDLHGLDPANGAVQYEDWHNTLHPDDRESVNADVSNFIEQGLPEFRCEYRVVHPQRGIRWLVGLARVTVNESGQPERLSGINLDITDRKQAEIERARLLKQAQSARAEAERANQIKDEFLAVLSHELRSPLNPILGWTQLLQTRRLDPTKTASALAIIERNVRLQTQLIDDLLDVAKILRGKLSMDTTPVNLGLVIESAIDTVTTAAVAKSIRLHSVLSNIGQICGDSTRLQQIVWNLLSNAIKFTPKGGQVEIRLERVNDQALMIVSDTGKGIDSDFLPHIFESFRQEDVSITRNYGGLGLGLTIVRTLVEAHGGTIFAESQGEGKGTTFTVCLPLLDTQPHKSQPDELPEFELDLTGIRVMAVDDQPDTREFFAELLTQYGAEVLSVSSAAEVLVSLESFQPDVLVSDIGMPEMDGYTLLQQIRSLPASKGGKVPAIALTAYARVEDRERSLVCGFQDHISKPLDLNRLVQAVSDLARSSKKNSSRKYD